MNIRILPIEHLNNENVLRSWMASRLAKAGALHTDGRRLYSGRLEIGFTDESGYKILINYTKSGGDFQNHRVSYHVGLAKRFADRIINSPKKHEEAYREGLHNRRKEVITWIEGSIAPDQDTYFKVTHQFRKQAGR